MFLLYAGAPVVSSVGILYSYQSLVFAAVLIMPNIVACLVSQLANVYLICVFLCPSIIQIKEYGSNTPNSPEFRNAFKSQKRGRTRLHLPLSTGTDSLALESSGVEILGLLDRGRPF